MISKNKESRRIWFVGRLFGMFIAAVAVALLAGQLWAQSDNGSIVGTVTDSTGAAIPDATITVTDQATNRVVSVQSQGDGTYVVSALPIGNYKVEVAKQAFKAESITFSLQISEVKELSFSLQVGSGTETVRVTNTSPLVDTESSSAGEVIDGRQVVDLPLNGRNFTALALLTPGVSRSAYANNAAGFGPGAAAAETWRNYDSGGAALAVNVLRPQANNYIMDGTDNNESLVSSIVIFPAIEDVAEFKTTTN